MNKILITLITLFLFPACTASIEKDKVAVTQSGKTDACAHLAEIKVIPLKADWPVEDINYKELLDSSLSDKKKCLVLQITNMTPMEDPRSEPTKVDGFVVGDLAFFLLSDFGIVSFDGVLPDEVTKRMPEQGVSAYFKWIRQDGNRERLQKLCYEWIAKSGN